MTDYLEQLLELLEEPEEKETSLTAQAVWKPQMGTVKHSRTGHLEKPPRQEEKAPVLAEQDSLESNGSIRGRDVQTPNSKRNMQALHSEWDVQIPNPEHALQVPGLEPRTQRHKFQAEGNRNRRWKLFPPRTGKEFAPGIVGTLTTSTEDALLYGAQGTPLYGTTDSASYAAKDTSIAGAVHMPHYGMGRLPFRAVEETLDVLDRGGSAASQWNSAQLSAEYRGAVSVQQTPAASFNSAAAMLEQRLAQSMAWSAPKVPGTAAVQDVTGTGLDLEELDQKVRRDARRYDGLLTPY